LQEHQSLSTSNLDNLSYLEPSTHQKFYGLDHLRALAISYVLLFHYFILSDGQPEWLPGFAKFGWSGVDLFFVLSGFLISSQLFAQIKLSINISWSSFFVKRFFRIIPAYLFTLLLYYTFIQFREKESLPPLWKFLTFTQNLGLNLKDYGTFSHAWSLCVEEHFYLLLPVTLMLLKATNLFKKSYWLILALFILGFALRNYSYNALYLPKSAYNDSWMYWYKYVYYPTYNRLDGLLTGVAIAGLYNFMPAYWNRISQYGNQTIIVSVLILTGGYFLCYHQSTYSASVYGFTLVSLGYGFMVVGAISPTSFLYKWKSKSTTFIAGLSYAVYLTHKGIIHFTHNNLEGFEINPHLMLIISILACIVFAYIINIIIEKPFIKLGRQIINRN
jgi:peptidoglycan/LPS O-acetylase OafA/YrhL